MPKQNQPAKETLDQQTSYFTFLPHMNDGFHIGYHPAPGVVCDRNQRPREWLESLARYMQTPGTDVGFSIPDVLAGEQQLRRMARLDPAEADRRQPMTDWRALLALLLLWDLWPHDDSWPLLELTRLDSGDTAFSRSITAALSPRRAPEGLWVFTLRRPHAPESQVLPLALLSNTLALVPAADGGDLSVLLPPCVDWYQEGRWLDPCQRLNAYDALRLMTRLETLKALNEEKTSPLYDEGAALCSLLDRFIAALQAAGRPWRALLEAGDAQALNDLRTLTLSAYTLPPSLEIAALPFAAAELNPADNLLLQHFSGERRPPASSEAGALSTWRGVPFAIGSHRCLLEPVRGRDQAKLLQALGEEIASLQTHNALWRKSAADTLLTLANQWENRAGLWPRLPALLRTWASELAAIPTAATREATLHYPLNGCSAATAALLDEALGLSDPLLIESPFSDCLSLTLTPPLEGETGRVAGLNRYALPPLSPRLCAWLTDCAEQDDLYAPHLDPDSLHYEADAQGITARFSLSRRLHGEGAVLSSTITFERRYTLSQSVCSGAAVVLTNLPQVVVWPNVRLSPGLWKTYYLCAANPAQLDAWGLDGHGWVQGEVRQRGSIRWQTVCISRFPAFVALRRGALSMGALVNDVARQVIKREPACAISIDFGSIATTVMLRQGRQVQPATLPKGLHGLLLRSPNVPETFLGEAFLPQWALQPGNPGAGSFYSVMDLFTDEPKRWLGVLQDGHIYYRQSLKALAGKEASGLYYDLKWGEEAYARACLRLFLKQVMLQAMLAARLYGSESASFRVSMPNAMPLHKREAYLEMARGLSRELAQETGLPITPGVPSVLYATENQADGLYFRSRSEVNVQSGYLNLDVGGGTADISLWLGGRRQAAIESSLLLGCRQMLFDSLMERHRQEVKEDFAYGSLEKATQEVTEVYEAEGDTVRGRHKCLLLMDDLFASYAEDIRRCMAQARSAGRISYVESLLLFSFGFLFTLCGEVLERARREESLSALLPQRMELCIAGNGGQLVKAFSDEQRTRLCALTLSRLSSSHPLQLVLPVQSRHPKQEAARGLLYDDSCLQSAIQGADRWNGTFDGQPVPDLITDYLSLFYHLFPQAAQRLMPRVFDESREAALNAAARMELDTIRANELSRFPRDDMAFYTACFTDLKRLWQI